MSQAYAPQVVICQIYLSPLLQMTHTREVSHGKEKTVELSVRDLDKINAKHSPLRLLMNNLKSMGSNFLPQIRQQLGLGKIKNQIH